MSIEWQIRSAMLDVQSSKELVKVARSNVDLATEEVQDASDRFKAGVDDNLPVVQAQAVLAQAQSQLVQDALPVQPVEADSWRGIRAWLSRSTRSIWAGRATLSSAAQPSMPNSVTYS